MPACENGRPQRTAPSLMRNLAATPSVASMTKSAPPNSSGRLSSVERRRRAVSTSHRRESAAAAAPPPTSTLARADGAGAVQDLAVQVGELDPIGVDQHQRADPGRRPAARRPGSRARRRRRPARGLSPAAPRRRSQLVPAVASSAPKKRPPPHDGAEAKRFSLALSPRVVISRLELAPASRLPGNGCCGFEGPVPQPLSIRYVGSLFLSVLVDLCESRRLSTGLDSTDRERAAAGRRRAAWLAVRAYTIMTFGRSGRRLSALPGCTVRRTVRCRRCRCRCARTDRCCRGRPKPVPLGLPRRACCLASCIGRRSGRWRWCGVRPVSALSATSGSPPAAARR